MSDDKNLTADSAVDAAMADAIGSTRLTEVKGGDAPATEDDGTVEGAEATAGLDADLVTDEEHEEQS
ncbi:hypothetical protein [Microbacterium sp. P03]|uniref:hypothetical protein n=1 Tax=Microbacterium sp. P03 TaxID=3366946 RepID=UPI00374534A2